MKRKLLICALTVICLSIVAYGTTAYFTYEDTATNVIVAGDIKIELREYAIPEGGGDPVEFEDVVNVVPGVEVSKIVKVENVSKNDAWIRISVDTAIELAQGVDGTPDTSLIGYDINTEYWVLKDGYYYYTQILKAGETTEALFTKVIFSRSMSNMYQNSTATIIVDAQATQVANNGSTVFEAAGWPAKD